MKILILGYKRSGKDTLAELWNEKFGVKFESSSMAAARIFIYDELKEKYGYTSFEECYEDRMTKRKEWYNLICGYNENDPTRLARKILEDSDVYVGMRDKKEVVRARFEKTFDLIVWVDALNRVGAEDRESCTVTKEDADIILDNNGAEHVFKTKALALGKALFGFREPPF